VLSRVSQVVRCYFSAAFRLTPGELTTAEFRQALEAEMEVPLELAGKVMGFLRECDQRKFSLSQPVAPLAAVGQARQLIEEAEAHRAVLRAAAAAAKHSQAKAPPVIAEKIKTGGNP
jgi:hypothetical protein